MKTLKFLSLLLFFSMAFSNFSSAQIDDSLPPWFNDPRVDQFFDQYFDALKMGNSRVIARSLQPQSNKGWDEGVAAITARKIASKGKQQLKALKLNRNMNTWSVKEVPSRNRGARSFIIFIPTNRMNPELVTSKSVMTHPYLARHFKRPDLKGGVVFEVETRISAELGAGMKVVINHEEMY
jgi:hypothetical protein